MEFTNSFSVQAPLELVWDFMLDANEVAPCVPGAKITEAVDDRHFKGTVKVKLGAVQMTYQGELQMEPDEQNRTIVLRAKGKESRGSGGASGVFTTRLTTGDDGMTHVEIHNQVDVSGRVAQFGRGIMQDVANRLLKEFAQCLEKKIEARSAGSDGSDDTSSTMHTQTAATSEAQDPRRDPPSQPSTSHSPHSVNSETPSPAPRADQNSPSSESQGSEVQAGAVATTVEPRAMKVQDLLLAVVRSRTAAGLRKIADLVEPK